MKYCMHFAPCGLKVWCAWSGAAGVLLHPLPMPVFLGQQRTSTKNDTGYISTAHQPHQTSTQWHQLLGPQIRVGFSTTVLKLKNQLLLLSPLISQVHGAHSADCWATMRTVSGMTKVVRRLAFFRTM